MIRYLNNNLVMKNQLCISKRLNMMTLKFLKIIYYINNNRVIMNNNSQIMPLFNNRKKTLINNPYPNLILLRLINNKQSKAQIHKTLNIMILYSHKTQHIRRSTRILNNNNPSKLYIIRMLSTKNNKRSKKIIFFNINPVMINNYHLSRLKFIKRPNPLNIPHLNTIIHSKHNPVSLNNNNNNLSIQ